MNRIYLFLLLLLSFSVSSFSQKNLEGEFSASIDAGTFGICIEFKNKNQFKYSYGGCVGGEKGSGIYKLDENNLWLYFDKVELPKKNNIKVTKLYPLEKKDSITLNINATAPDGLPLEIFFLSKKGQRIKGQFYKTNPDNGYVAIKLPYENKKYIYEVDYIGLESAYMEIDQRYSYKISFKLDNAPFYSIISQDTIHYKLKNITQDYFIRDDNIKFERKIKSND